MKIGKLTLEIELLPLLDHHVHLPLVALDDVEVNAIASPAGLNLATMMVPSNAPSTMDIFIDKLAVTNANISYRDVAGVDNHVDKLAITTGLVVRSSGAISGHADVDGTWRERQQPLHVDGKFALDGHNVDVSTALVKLGDASVALHGIHFSGVALGGTVDIKAPHKLIGELLPNSPLLTDVTLTMTFRPTLFSTMATLSGTAGKATMTGVLSLDPVATPPRVVGTLNVSNFDAAAIARGTPVTDGNVSMLFDASIDPSKIGLEAIRGRVTAHAHGKFDRIEVARADIAARISGGHINAAVDAHAAGDARFAAIVSADVEANSVIAVEHARVVAHVGDLGAAASGLLPNKGTDAHVLKGSLDARFTARGRVSAKNIELDLESHVDAENVQYDTIGIGHVQADVQATGLPYRPTGHADVHIAGISSAGKPVGEITLGADSLPNHHIAVAVRTHPMNSPLMLDLDADVGLSQRELAVALGHHRLLTRGVDWDGDGGSIIVNDQQIAVRDLRTTIGAGDIDIDASYQREGRRAGDIAGHIRAHGLDFAEVAKSLGLGPLAGHGELDIHVSGHGKTLHGELHGDVRGLVIKAKAAPLDIVANGQLAPGRLQFDGTVDNKALGSVKASVDVDTPASITDVKAWARLPRTALRKAEFTVGKLDITALLRALGQADTAPQPWKGSVDGQFSLTDKHVGGKMSLSGLSSSHLPTQIDGDITLADGAPMPGDNPTVVVDAQVTAKDMAVATAHATLEMPQHLFDAKAWLSLGANAVRGATLNVDGAMLDTELTRRFGIVAPLAGHATLAVDVAAGLTSTTATLHIDKFIGGPVIRPVTLDFTTVVDRNGIDSSLAASVEKVQLLDAKVHAALNIAALLADAPDTSETMVARLKATPITGTAAIDRVEVDALSRALGRSQKLVGTVLFNGSLAGTVGKPDATFKATLTDFGVEQPQLHELTVDGHYLAGVIDSHVVGTEINAGTLDVKAHADLANLAGATASLHARSFDFAPLARLAPDTFLGVAGFLDASLDMTGIDPTSGAVEGRVQLTHAEFPIEATIGTLRAGRVLIEAHGGDVKMTATGTVGDGSVDVEASTKLTGLMPSNGKADITLHNLVLLNAQQPRVSGKIHADMTRDSSLWHVDAKFTGGDITIPDASAVPVAMPRRPYRRTNNRASITVRTPSKRFANANKWCFACA